MRVQAGGYIATPLLLASSCQGPKLALERRVKRNDSFNMLKPDICSGRKDIENSALSLKRKKEVYPHIYRILWGIINEAVLSTLGPQPL
jgi:hypothetical protein